MIAQVTRVGTRTHYMASIKAMRRGMKQYFPRNYRGAGMPVTTYLNSKQTLSKQKRLKG